MEQSQPSACATALDYCRRGWSPIPVIIRGKRPLNPDQKYNGGWQDLRITDQNASRYFNGKPQNIGVLLGDPSDSLVDIDLDCQEAISLAPQFLPPTEAIFGRASKQHSHWLYRSPIEKTQQFKDPIDKSVLLELRSNGAQTVFPGSVHESGELIEWEACLDPGDVRSDLLDKAVGELAAATLLARH